MITEYEIDIIIEIPEVDKVVQELKESFLAQEAPLFEMVNHDFLALILLTPHVGVALANGSISLFEELTLNKKARRFSKGGTFLRKDPVVRMMNCLIKNFERWEDKFIDALKTIMNLTFEKDHLKIDIPTEHLSVEDFDKMLLKTPYIFVKYLKAFFLTEEDAITLHRKISPIEYEKIKFIGERLGLNQYSIFKMFCSTFKIK